MRLGCCWQVNGRYLPRPVSVKYWLWPLTTNLCPPWRISCAGAEWCCFDRVWSCPLCAGPGVSQVVRAKVSPHLCWAQSHPVWAVEQSEMAATGAGLGDSQVKPSCESRLAAASPRPRDHWCQLSFVWEDLGSCAAWAKTAIPMEKQLEWASKLGGELVGRSVLARLVESQIWHQVAGSVALCEKGLGKGQWPLLAPMPDTSFSSSMPLVPFQQLSSAGAQREWVWVGESECGFFKWNCLELQKFLPPAQSPLVVQLEVVGTYLPSTGTLVWSWVYSLLRRPSQIFIHHMWVWDQHIPCLHPSYQTGWMRFP